VLLAGEYYRRTGNGDLIARLWPNISAALSWINRYADPDGDDFIEYARHSSKGLTTQGWKDSVDSVFHADGSLADGPIALCEVQAYVFAAWRAAAEMAAVLGKRSEAEEFLQKAARLQAQFEQTFWSDELETYMLALDGRKQPCRVRTSNAGHCLFAGIAGRERSRRVARTLLDQASFSGWGVRTVATTESRYNPMSYHNGSIWPHDNALIAAGCARYGLKQPALDILTGLFDASLFVDLHRMPELFCGFVRRPGEGPTLYPVACAPQAWAAGSVFMLLSSVLGLSIDAVARQIRFDRPALPEFLQKVQVTNLAVGPAKVDLVIERHARDVGINLAGREGEIEIIVVK
jgi:glycogen debranching enzyme